VFGIVLQRAVEVDDDYESERRERGKKWNPNEYRWVL
jgi:hypothetical protein